jgi:hypothetical protein
MPEVREDPIRLVETLITMGKRTEALGIKIDKPGLVVAFAGSKIGGRFPISQMDALKRAA